MVERILVILLLSIILTGCGNINTSETYEWNGGYCIEDNGRLNYISTGSKVHYQCEVCGKEYRFDEVMTYDSTREDKTEKKADVSP